MTAWQRVGRRHEQYPREECCSVNNGDPIQVQKEKTAALIQSQERDLHSAAAFWNIYPKIIFGLPNGSAFVFEKDMRFMEDGTFVGTFEVDTEAGTFTLKYQPAIFEDTTCYFTWEGDHMTVEYPWTVVGKQVPEEAE